MINTPTKGDRVSEKHVGNLTTGVLALLGVVIFFSFGASFLLIHLSVMVAFVVGRFVATPQSGTNASGIPDLPDALSRFVSLSQNPRLQPIDEQWQAMINAVGEHQDPIFKNLATQQLLNNSDVFARLATGIVDYSSTESWRVAYEAILRSRGLYRYRSVSHVESVHYWQDGPGQMSTRLNLELQSSNQLIVERIAIVSDSLWPHAARLPVPPIYSWLTEQAHSGVQVKLVRESLLASEPELICDFGIYGNRAIGIQNSDVSGRTVRFQLNFDFKALERAEKIWERLSVYAVSLAETLDRQA